MSKKFDKKDVVVENDMLIEENVVSNQPVVYVATMTYITDGVVYQVGDPVPNGEALELVGLAVKQSI